MAKLLARRAVMARSSSSGVADEPPPAASEPRDRVRCANDDAAALIEFALLLPFLAIIVFGTIDIGRAYQYKNRATNMAREAAAFAQYQPTKVSGCPFGTLKTIAESARNEDRQMAADPNFGTITVYRAPAYALGATPTWTAYSGCTTAASLVPPGSRVKVVVSYNFRPVTPIVTAITGNPKVLTGYAEVTVQG